MGFTQNLHLYPYNLLNTHTLYEHDHEKEAISHILEINQLKPWNHKQLTKRDDAHFQLSGYVKRNFYW